MQPQLVSSVVAAYNYPTEAIGHEIHFAHGSRGSKADEVDIIVYDSDNLPFALMELKSHHDFEREKYPAIRIPTIRHRSPYRSSQDCSSSQQ